MQLDYRCDFALGRPCSLLLRGLIACGLAVALRVYLEPDQSWMLLGSGAAMLALALHLHRFLSSYLLADNRLYSKERERVRPPWLWMLTPAAVFAALYVTGCASDKTPSVVLLLLGLILLPAGLSGLDPVRFPGDAVRMMRLFTGLVVVDAPGCWRPRTDRRALRRWLWGATAFGLAASLPVEVSTVAILALWASLASVLASLVTLEQRIEAVAGRRTTIFDSLTDRLINSSDKTETEHFLFGVYYKTKAPALIHKNYLRSSHIYIAGGSGRNKTAIGITCLLIACLRDPNSGPLLVIDPKGDRAFQETIRLEAKKAGRKFKFFTTIQGLKSCELDILGQLDPERRGIAQAAQFLLSATGRDPGEGWGKTYFGSRSRRLCVKAFAAAKAKYGRMPKTWHELHDVAEKLDAADRYDAQEALDLLHAFTLYPALSTTKPPTDGNVIHMPTAWEGREVVLLHCPGLTESATREICVLSVYLFLDAGTQWKLAGKPKRNGLVCCDEAQIIAAGGSFINALNMSRGQADTTLILCSQDFRAAKERSPELFAAIKIDCALQCWYSLSEEDAEYAEMMAGKKVQWEVSYRTLYDDWGYPFVAPNYRPIERPRFSQDEARESSNADLECVVLTLRDWGFVQHQRIPVRVEGLYPLSLLEYERRERQPFQRRKDQRKRQTSMPTNNGAKRKAQEDELEGF